MEPSLYEKLGGEAAVMAAVDSFYEKVIADERTRPFFESLNIEAQVRKQVAFMSWAFGGPSEYKGQSLRRAHASLVPRGLTDVHFEAIITHLRETLKELGAGDELIQEVVRIIEPTRRDVLGR